MRQTFALIGAGATATAYAVALATRRGRQFRRDYTWLSVVAGVGLTLAWLAASDRRAAQRAIEFFAITGTPIVILCVGEAMDRDEELDEYHRHSRR